MCWFVGLSVTDKFKKQIRAGISHIKFTFSLHRTDNTGRVDVNVNAIVREVVGIKEGKL